MYTSSTGPCGGFPKPMALSLRRWQDMKGQLRVSCRIRPLSVKEKAQNLGDALEGLEGKCRLKSPYFLSLCLGDIIRLVVGW